MKGFVIFLEYDNCLETVGKLHVRMIKTLTCSVSNTSSRLCNLIGQPKSWLSESRKSTNVTRRYLRDQYVPSWGRDYQPHCVMSSYLFNNIVEFNLACFMALLYVGDLKMNSRHDLLLAALAASWHYMYQCFKEALVHIYLRRLRLQPLFPQEMQVCIFTFYYTLQVQVLNLQN